MKNLKKYFLNGLILCSLWLATQGCKDKFISPASPTGTTVGEKISTTDNLTILTEALNKTNQEASLSNNNSGVFTVFAPSDSAFLVYFKAKLGKPNYTVDSVLAYINNTMSTTSAVTISGLSTILTYHIASSAITTDMVSNAQGIATLNGARLSLSKVGSNVFLNADFNSTGAGNGAKFEGDEVIASNGIIHIIDRVLIPVSNASAASVLGVSVSYSTNPPTVTVSASGSNFNIMANAIAVTGLAPVILPNTTPLPDFTVFAPADANFVTYLMTTYPASGVINEATAITFVKGLNATTTPTLADFTETIKKHIVPGRFLTSDFSGQVLATLSTSFTITATSTDVNGIAFVTKDQLTNAGVVQVIAGVLQ